MWKGGNSEMSKFELPKEPRFYNWESPITKIMGEIQNQIVKQEENCIFAIKQSIGYSVDKNELIKALNYDREQYDKGYRDGVKETFKAELEEIKAEAEELIEHCDSDYDFEEIYGIRLVVGILDNRLSELKGENNG